MRKRAMSFDVWERKYVPIKNTIEEGSNYDGCMFETFGEEVKAVQAAANKNPQTVWTLVDGDNNACYITPGAHFVNRLGYFITEKPFTDKDNEDLTVKA